MQGQVVIPGGSLSDPVLRKADGDWTYTLASVVDDAALGISHIIRGDDHRTNTAIQVELFQALGASLPSLRPFAAALRAGWCAALQADR